MLISQNCNLSTKLPHFPKDCKLAKLKPLYKKGTKTDPKSFKGDLPFSNSLQKDRKRIT